MKAHNLGALLLMYDENVRYVTSTLTPGWNRLKPGLRYALLCGDGAPVLFEQGDIGFQIQRHAPWIPQENIRYSYAWIKGAAGPASRQQVKKFTDALVREMRRYDVADQTLGVDFIDINMLNQFNEAKIKWADGMTPMMEARAIKNVDEQECLRIVGAIGDAAPRGDHAGHRAQVALGAGGVGLPGGGPGRRQPLGPRPRARAVRPAGHFTDLVARPPARDPAGHGVRARDAARQALRVGRADRG